MPSQLERIEHHYEIEPAVCALGHALKRIGEEISEQLDCVPAQFFVHRHIRGKYTCVCCQTVMAAAMPAQIIDKGIPAAGLLAQVIIAKFDDHLPLFRQEEIYRRSGANIPRSSMAGWVGQCGVRLQPLVQAMTQHLLAKSYDFFFNYYFTLFLTPTMFLSGVFFPRDQLPGVMRVVSDWLPLTAAVELIRPLFLGQLPAQGLQHLAVLVAYAVVGFWLVLTRKRFKS